MIERDNHMRNSDRDNDHVSGGNADQQQGATHNDAERDPYFDKMEARHYTIYLGGRFFIGDRVTDQLSSKIDFMNGHLHCIATISTVFDKIGFGNGRREEVYNYAEAWIKSLKRTHYEGRKFDPRHLGDVQDKVGRKWQNKWRGFITKGVKGDCSKYYAHIHDNVCGGDEGLYKWVLDWCAHLIQRPWEKPEVALVLKGPEGIGKSRFGDVLRVLIDGKDSQFATRDTIRHSFTTGDPNNIYGDYTGHLDEKIFLQLEEVGTWGGDKRHEGKLKHFISGKSITINPKNIPAYECDNFMRIVMTSNNEWAIPASFDSRRFTVCEVSSAHIQDYEYFGAIHEELNNGGYEAFMYDLEQRDVSQFDCHESYKTEALIEQKLATMEFIAKWWYNVLQTGRIESYDNDVDAYNRDTIVVIAAKLYQNYHDHHKRMRPRSPLLNDIKFAEEWRQLLPKVVDGKIVTKKLVIDSAVEKARKGTYPNRTYCYILPSLSVCRELWEFRIKGKIQWSDVVKWEAPEFGGA